MTRIVLNLHGSWRFAKDTKNIWYLHIIYRGIYCCFKRGVALRKLFPLAPVCVTISVNSSVLTTCSLSLSVHHFLKAGKLPCCLYACEQPLLRDGPTAVLYVQLYYIIWKLINLNFSNFSIVNRSTEFLRFGGYYRRVKIEFTYNNNYHSTIEMAPSKIYIVRVPPSNLLVWGRWSQVARLWINTVNL